MSKHTGGLAIDPALNMPPTPPTYPTSPKAGGKRPTDVEWQEAEWRILTSLDIRSEYEAMGVLFVKDQPTHKGWLDCHAAGRDDKTASAAVNVGTEPGFRGRYRDLGGQGDSHNLWEFAVKFGNIPGVRDWREARQYFARKAGVELPGGREPTRSTQDNPCPVCSGWRGCYWYDNGLHVCLAQGKGDRVEGWRCYGPAKKEKRGWLWRRKQKPKDEQTEPIEPLIEDDLEFVETPPEHQPFYDLLKVLWDRGWAAGYSVGGVLEYDRRSDGRQLHVLRPDWPADRLWDWVPYVGEAARRRGFVTPCEVGNAWDLRDAVRLGDAHGIEQCTRVARYLDATLPADLAEVVATMREKSKPAQQDAAESIPPSPDEPGTPPAAPPDERAFFSVREEVLVPTTPSSAGLDHGKQKRKGHAPAGPGNDPAAGGPGGRPCPAGASVLLLCRQSGTRGMVLRLGCKRWTCKVCFERLKRCWAASLVAHLRLCERPLHLLRGCEEDYEAAKERISRWAVKRNAPTQYCRVKLAGGENLLVTTADIAGAGRVSADAAAREVAAAIAAIPLGAKRPITASHCWKLPEGGSGQFSRVGNPADPEATAEALRQMGAEVTKQGVSKRGGAAVEATYFYKFDPACDLLDIAYALKWAEAGSVPQAVAARGPVPDPEPLFDALLEGWIEGDWLDSGPAVKPPSIKTPKSPPLPAAEPKQQTLPFPTPPGKGHVGLNF